jgi:NAD(P)-dependent dehydrogenase (short-subunit alcohol dehydrogenase family)
MRAQANRQERRRRAGRRFEPGGPRPLFAKVEQEKGRLDVLFANAGVPASAPFGSISEAHFDKAFNINVKGDNLDEKRRLDQSPIDPHFEDA